MGTARTRRRAISLAEASAGISRTPFKDALRLEIAEAVAANNPRAIRKIARKLLDLAAKGEPWAIKELIDRVDGKAVQPISNDGDNPFMIQEIKRTIVKASG
jgi:hypothetical protein